MTDDVKEFDAANFDFNTLDQPDGESSEVDMDALHQLGILEDTEITPKEAAPKPAVKKDSAPSRLEQIIKELSGNPNQFDKEVEDQVEGIEESEGEEEGEEVGDQPKEESPQTDTFTIKVNGQTKEVTRDELIELAQKGGDYTQKTQELSKQRLSFEEMAKKLEEQKASAFQEIETERQKFKSDLETKSQWDFVVDFIKQDNPDLYNEIQDSFKQATMYYRNPLIDNLHKEIEQLKQRSVKSEDQELANQYYSELNAVKSSIIPELNRLGLTIDEEKIKDAWVKGAKDVKSALYGVYGADINKLYASRLKVESTKKRVGSAGRAKSLAGSAKVTSGGSNKSAFNSYGDITRKILGY